MLELWPSNVVQGCNRCQAIQVCRVAVSKPAKYSMLSTGRLPRTLAILSWWWWWSSTSQLPALGNHTYLCSWTGYVRHRPDIGDRHYFFVEEVSPAWKCRHHAATASPTKYCVPNLASRESMSHVYPSPQSSFSTCQSFQQSFAHSMQSSA